MKQSRTLREENWKDNSTETLISGCRYLLVSVDNCQVEKGVILGILMIVHIPILIIAKLLNMWFWDTFGLVAWNLSVTELYSLFSSNISLHSFESQLYGKNLSNPRGHLFWPVCLIYEWYSFKSYVSKILIKEQVNNVIFCVETLIILLTKVLYIQQIGQTLYMKGCECGKEVSLSLFNSTFFLFYFLPTFQYSCTYHLS